ncbi:MAG: alkaline phosphatase family protein [Bdellovibrionota bacterium]|nr:MAG: alkaline phosphatase family protein [Bdellovibrionota bacterium]
MAISRRTFIKAASLGSVAASLPKRSWASSSTVSRTHRSAKVVVLGMDGMEPSLLRRFMNEGIMPTFKRFLEGGGSLQNLATTMPPQSPVAWSSFISGTNPGGHGIYDFIHRDPATFTPYLSTSRSSGSSKHLEIGGYKIPLVAGKMDLMRQGPTLWTTLEEHDVPATVFQIPANFPVTSASTRAVSGMGTPDLLGGYGICSYFTDDYVTGMKSDGAKIRRVRVIDHKVEAKITGPRNTFKDGEPETDVPFTLYRDPWEPTLRIDILGQRIVLREGEFSDWVPISFELLPYFASIGGVVRFYAKQVHPRLKLYVTPINIDPMDPAFPICSPPEYSRELAEAVGRFYTQGLPADTKALQNGILSDDDYLRQAKIVLEENLRVLHHELDRFHEGLFYFYFSSLDQNCHMLYRNMDPAHPLYDPKASEEVKNAVRYFYRQMDLALKDTLAKVGSDATVLIASDHGFGHFTREFHLSSWLVQEGYTKLKVPLGETEGDVYNIVDWSKTRAYALGINGIYVNMIGREKNGIVAPTDAQALKDEIAAKLIAVTDPQNGNAIISNVYDSLRIYSGPFMALAPDLQVGYRPNYRVSDEGILGKFPATIIGDRTNKWASDHCIDPIFVPGVLLSNREIRIQDPAIWDMAPSILTLMGLPTPRSMTGRNIFAV